MRIPTAESAVERLNRKSAAAARKSSIMQAKVYSSTGPVSLSGGAGRAMMSA